MIYNLELLTPGIIFVYISENITQIFYVYPDLMTVFFLMKAIY